jgi:DNA polymerase (family X)
VKIAQIAKGQHVGNSRGLRYSHRLEHASLRFWGTLVIDTKAVVKILEEIAVLLELSGENPFKSRSYASVARNLEQQGEDVNTLVKEGRLREIKGVGDALEQKIEELVTTGKLKYYEDLRAKFPDSLFELFEIPGLGGKRIKHLYEDEKITSLDELQAACESGRIAD